jgi:hypothetical protein
MNQENKRPITLEDLLRLKRAERPAAEFWTQFDRELRTKQLAALVKREPWWRQLPFNVSWLSRYRVPLGTTAVMALTFMVAREYRSDSAPNVPVAVEPAAPVVAEATGILRIEPMAPAFADAAVLPAFAVREEPSIIAEPAAVEAPVPTNRSQIVSLLNDSLATDFVAASFAGTPVAEPLAARNVRGSGGFEMRAMPERASTVDPFLQMRDPTTERRSARVQATMASLGSAALPARIGAPLTTRNYAEEKFYEEQPGRLEGRKEGFSVRF